MFSVVKILIFGWEGIRDNSCLVVYVCGVSCKFVDKNSLGGAELRAQQSFFIFSVLIINR